MLSLSQKEVVPFLTRAFMPIMETIFAGLRQPVDEDDEVVSLGDRADPQLAPTGRRPAQAEGRPLGSSRVS